MLPAHFRLETCTDIPPWRSFKEREKLGLGKPHHHRLSGKAHDAIFYVAIKLCTHWPIIVSIPVVGYLGGLWWLMEGYCHYWKKTFSTTKSLSKEANRKVLFFGGDFLLQLPLSLVVKLLGHDQKVMGSYSDSFVGIQIMAEHGE